MSALEKALTELIEAAVAKAVGGKASTGGAANTTTKPATGGKGGKGATKPKHSAEEVKAILIRVKDEIGMDEAKGIITGTGAAADLASIKPENFDAVYDEAEALLNGGGDPDENGGL